MATLGCLPYNQKCCAVFPYPLSLIRIQPDSLAGICGEEIYCLVLIFIQVVAVLEPDQGCAELRYRFFWYIWLLK